MEQEKEKVINSFEILNSIDFKDKIKQKIGLNYLSWAYAWGELKKNFPDAYYTIYDRKVVEVVEETIEDNGVIQKRRSESTNSVPYFTDGRTAYVKVGVTINDVEYVELLPVMDAKNNAVPISVITMTAVNKSIQRAFVKACARHGLGLYIYAGEDLPEAKSIDFKAIENAAIKTPLKNDFSKTDFDENLAMAIDFVKKSVNIYSKKQYETLAKFISSNNNNKLLSKFVYEEDNEALQKIVNYIEEFKKTVGDNN